MNQTVEYIKELTAIASPTGFTREVSDYLVTVSYTHLDVYKRQP